MWLQVQSCALLSLESTRHEWGERLDCLQLESNAIANLLPGGLRPATRSTPRLHVCLVVFTLHVFFLDEARLSPFVLKWTSCHYTPCYCYFFRRFYRVLRQEGVLFGKMFVLRASWRVCVSSDVDIADLK